MGTFIGHFTGAEVAQQLCACIGCQECLLACPTIDQPIPLGNLNSQTLSGPITLPVAQFARACTQCGACANVCPVGLRRDAMMLWLKLRLLCAAQVQTSATQEEVVVEQAQQQQFKAQVSATREEVVVKRAQQRQFKAQVPATREEVAVEQAQQRQFKVPFSF